MIPEPAIELVDGVLGALRSASDPRALDLRRFLEDAREGLLGAEAIGREAALWRELTSRGLAPDAVDGTALVEVLDALSHLPATDEPGAPPSSEPVNDLERALAAAIEDPWQRPKLWQALHDSELVLPVVAYDARPGEQLSLNFLTIPLDDGPLVVGFTAEERFEALLSGDADFPRALASGAELLPIWPAGHSLQLNPGHELGIVLTPEEILHLPHGPAGLRV